MIVEKVVWMWRVSASSSDDSSTTSGSSWMRAIRYGCSETNSSSRTRVPPCTRIRRVPSGIRSMRAIVPATPTRYRSSGPGCSISASLLATITSIRSRLSASFTSCTERSWPTASGVIEFGNATVSFSGRTGSVSGSLASAAGLLDRLLEALDDLDRHDSTGPSSSRAEIGTWRLSSSAAIGSSTRRIPSS